MKKRQLIAVAMASAVAASSLAACGSSSGTTSTTAAKAAETKAAETQAAAGSSTEAVKEAVPCTGFDSLPDSDYVDGEKDGQTYPISQEKITMKMWYPFGSSMAELADYNDSEFWQWYEEKTNIHIEWIVPATGTEKDSFQLLFAGDMPDMVWANPVSYGTYRDGEDASIEDGYFINMADYLQYAPNYVSWLKNHENFGRAAFTDSGKMSGLWGTWKSLSDEVYADQGIAIRKDFLDKVGKEVPTTYAEWEDVLTAFRDELHIEAPYYTSKYGIDYGEFMAGYGVAPYFYQVDGTVKYGPLEDGYKDYLTMMNRWWSEGLLDKDFATRQTSGIMADNDMQLNDKVGSLIDYGTRMGDAYVSRGATNPDVWYVGCPQPKLSADAADPAWRQYQNGMDHFIGTVINISADCPYIEEAIRWVDGLYAVDNYLNANYGIESEEGTTWYKADDGHRIGDYDFRYHNPNGLSSGTVAVKYWAKNPPVRVEAMQFEQNSETVQNAYKTWSQYEPKNYISPRTTMTTEEGTEYASKYTDIETYVQECNVKFIMGQMSLDDYDSYRETLKSMGIERCIELQQAAYDRYSSR